MEDMEKKAASEMAPIMAKAQTFMVNSEETYAAADTIIVEIKTKVKEREAELLPPKESATKTWKAMCALVKKYIDDPLEACKTLDRKRYGWKQAEDRRRAAEVEKLRIEAQRKQEEERRAEAAKIAAEAKRQADEAIALAERMKAADMSEQAEAVLVSAGEVEEREVERAQEILDAPVAPVFVPEPVKVEKPEGQSYVANWQARVVDANLVPREYCIPDLVALGKYAKLMKDKASIPGVVFEDVGSVRRRL
jgi:hypothetical protein